MSPALGIEPWSPAWEVKPIPLHHRASCNYRENKHLKISCYSQTGDTFFTNWRHTKSVSENCHNSWTVQDSFMELHRWAQLIKMCVIGKNENSCYFMFFSYLPMINELNRHITQKLIKEKFSFLPMTHILISWAQLWSSLSYLIRCKSYGNFR